MNFEQLKKQWDEQTGDTIEITEESITKTISISESIRKSYKTATIYNILALVFLIVIPFFENLSNTITAIYYALLLQTTLVTILSLRRFYVFGRMTRDKSVFSSTENLLKIYYELRFAIDTYQSLSYIMILPSILMYFILIGQDQAEKWLLKYYHFGQTFQTEPTFLLWNFLGLIAFLAFVFVYSHRQLTKRYLKPLREIKQVIDDLTTE